MLSISSENLKTFFNPYHAAGLFLYTLKTSENLRFSDVFRGYRKRIVAWNGSKVEECLTVCFRLFAQPTTWIAKGNYTFCIIHGLCEQYNIPVDGGGSVNLRPQKWRYVRRPSGCKPRILWVHLLSVQFTLRVHKKQLLTDIQQKSCSKFPKICRKVTAPEILFLWLGERPVQVFSASIGAFLWILRNL